MKAKTNYLLIGGFGILVLITILIIIYRYIQNERRKREQERLRRQLDELSNDDDYDTDGIDELIKKRQEQMDLINQKQRKEAEQKFKETGKRTIAEDTTKRTYVEKESKGVTLDDLDNDGSSIYVLD